jgi:hypothetical protein
VFEHQRDLVLHAQEHTAQVDVDDSVPLLFRKIGYRRWRVFDTRIVEGEVKVPERFDGRV